MDSENSIQFNKTDDVDGETQCRTCLEKHSKNQLYSLNSKNLTILNDGSEQTIAEIYRQCTQLLYEPEDDCCKWICQYCTEKMIDFFQFRKMCIDSYNTLKLTKAVKVNSLKAEITTDEYDDSFTCGMELENAVAIKQEVSFDCNADQTNDLVDETQINTNLNVSMDIPKFIRKAEANAQLQCEKEKSDDDKNDGVFAAFDDFYDDDDDSNDNLEKEIPIQRKSCTRMATEAAKIVKDPTALKTDGNNVMPNQKVAIVCDKCPRKFFSKNRYDAHMRRHNGLKAYQCEDCDKSFQKISSLKTHMDVNHYDESKGRPEYICGVEQCGKTYNRKESLRLHMQSVHFGRKPNTSEKTCEQCGKVFKNNAALIKHTYTHTKVTPHKCDICAKMFATAHKLKEHVMRHNGIKNHVCPTCGLRKITGHELRVHMRCHLNVEYPCNMCSSVFTNEDKMRRHKQVVHCDTFNTLKPTKVMNDNSLKSEITTDSITYQMDFGNAAARKQAIDCNAEQTNKQINETQANTNSNVNKDKAIPDAEVNAQAQNETEKPDVDLAVFDDFVDDNDDDSDDSDDNSEKALSIERKPSGRAATQADKSGKKLIDIKKDCNTIRPNQNEPIYACDKCPRRFFKENRYDAHMRRHIGLKAYQCEHCDKSFQKISSLKTHMDINHYDESMGRPEYICGVEQCGKTYNRKESLRLHMQSVHFGRKSNTSEKICETCGKVFKNNAALIKHTYTHTKVTPHKCMQCAKMFATAHKLKEHMLRHNGIKNHVCPTCGLRKITGHELRVHMRCHLNVEYPCDMCSSVFTNKDNMRRHRQVVHCGIKPYKCPYCDQSFGKADTRKHHVARHTGEKPYACQICDKRFIQSVALKTHMKTHNKNK